MDKGKELKKLEAEISKCDICKEHGIGKMVFGEGDVNAKVMFVGEAPGKNEAKVGRPFIGRSGKLLRKMITDLGLKEKEVYITSPVKYLPEYGTPKPRDIEHARVHFNKQIGIIDPKMIVLLGSTAAQAILEEKLPILKMHGASIEKNDRTYFLTLHPAAAVRFQKFRLLISEDFKKLKKLL